MNVNEFMVGYFDPYKFEQLKIGDLKIESFDDNFIVTLLISNNVPWKISIEYSEFDELKIKSEFVIEIVFPSF